jgi:polysaccharide pyruvyl transferase WcaK-like protein
MRILLDQAVYDQRNKGNVALLQSAIQKLRRLWPDASFYVLTEAPYLLKLYCPNVYPVSVHPWQNFSQKRRQFDYFDRLVPARVLQILLEFREEIWHRFPTLFSGGWRQIARARFSGKGTFQRKELDARLKSAEIVISSGQIDGGSDDLKQALQNSDLVVATGGGYLCDWDKSFRPQVFDTLEIAVHLGKPTAMVGVGASTLEDPECRTRLKNVLPLVDQIFIREPKIARPLLESLGVIPDRIFMTGDDAIELAYKARQPRWGKHIGVNLRLARYTEVERAYIEKIRSVIHQAAQKYNATLLALPTSSNIKEADLEVIREILKGYKRVSIDWQRFDAPVNMIKKIMRCRLVVSGSYHPAVFALSQGIPAVALVKSIAYIHKFSALQDEFGPACQIVNLDDERLPEKLMNAIETAWNTAEEVRPQLLKAAARQVEWGHAGYQRLYDLVEHELRDMKELAK